MIHRILHFAIQPLQQALAFLVLLIIAITAGPSILGALTGAVACYLYYVRGYDLNDPEFEDAP